MISGASIVDQSSLYDGSNRLIQQQDTAGANNGQLHIYNYTYSPTTGDRASASADGVQTQYTYDTSHQLLSETSGADTTSYSYDPYNNRATLVTSAGTTAYSYTDANAPTELTLKTDPTGKQTTYSYDPSGNLRTAVYDPTGVDQTTSYTYDGSNRLSTVSEPNGVSVGHAYDDATGLRHRRHPRRPPPRRTTAAPSPRVSTASSPTC